VGANQKAIFAMTVDKAQAVRERVFRETRRYYSQFKDKERDKYKKLEKGQKKRKKNINSINDINCECVCFA
jgi:hypothetical protein